MKYLKTFFIMIKKSSTCLNLDQFRSVLIASMFEEILDEFQMKMALKL